MSGYAKTRGIGMISWRDKLGECVGMCWDHSKLEARGERLWTLMLIESLRKTPLYLHDRTSKLARKSLR